MLYNCFCVICKKDIKIEVPQDIGGISTLDIDLYCELGHKVNILGKGKYIPSKVNRERYKKNENLWKNCRKLGIDNE